MRDPTDEPLSPGPVEDRLADRLERAPRPGPARAAAVPLLRRLGALDRRAYRAVARLPTPALDAPLRRLSVFANRSTPWLLTAGMLAVAGGPRGRRAALTGVAAVAVTSFAVNLPMKLAGARRRPDRDAADVPVTRHVPMPGSTSFPSGHSASAAAFAVAVGGVLPAARLPLAVAGGAVAFSRVYTGVHYPGDVLVGLATGAAIGRLTVRAGDALARRRAGH